MNHRVVALSLLAASLALGAAAHADGRKRKVTTPPPPVPDYWLGDFTSDSHVEEGTATAGTVVIPTDGSPPPDAILIQPLDPAHFVTAAKAEAKDKDQLYRASYVALEFDMSVIPMVLVVDATVDATKQPVLVKPSKKVTSALRKVAKKATGYREVSGFAVGVADLDADRTPDVALLAGCIRSEDGPCYDSLTILLERDGTGWKYIPNE